MASLDCLQQQRGKYETYSRLWVTDKKRVMHPKPSFSNSTNAKAEHPNCSWRAPPSLPTSGNPAPRLLPPLCSRRAHPSFPPSGDPATRLLPPLHSQRASSPAQPASFLPKMRAPFASSVGELFFYCAYPILRLPLVLHELLKNEDSLSSFVRFPFYFFPLFSPFLNL
jgi:hypothetical protein